MDPLNHRYLSPADLRRLRHLALSSPGPVEGRFTGRHVSRQRGRSIEFADYRPYMPGDQLADIDWKVYGRSDRLFIRLFEHQAELTVHLVIDASASMAYPEIHGDEDSKYDHACRIAAAIAFLALQHQDRAGLALAQNGLKSWQEPQASPAQVMRLLERMESLNPAANADLAAALSNVEQRITGKGLVIIFSDLLEDADPILAAMSRLKARGVHGILFHILHPHERNLPHCDQSIFVDSETFDRLAVSPEDIRREYQRSIVHFCRGWAQSCRNRGIDYHLTSPGEDYLKLLRGYLRS